MVLLILVSNVILVVMLENGGLDVVLLIVFSEKLNVFVLIVPILFVKSPKNAMVMVIVFLLQLLFNQKDILAEIETRTIRKDLVMGKESVLYRC